MTQHPAVDDAPPVYEDIEPDEEWLEDESEETPPRPRRKLLSPLPMTLLVVLLIVGGFFAGVEVEKNRAPPGVPAVSRRGCLHSAAPRPAEPQKARRSAVRVPWGRRWSSRRRFLGGPDDR